MSEVTPSAPVAPLTKAGSAAKIVIAGVLTIVVGAAAVGAWFATRRDTRAARGAAGALEDTIYLAVQPFRDVSPDALSPSLGEGFAQTVRARLAGSGTVRVMEGLPAESAARKSDDARAICRELGANRLLRGSLQRSEETLRVTYTITDAIEGAYADLFAIQDRLAEQVLEKFGGRTPTSGQPANTLTFQQDRYLEAVGHLVRDENAASVDKAIEILTGLGDSPTVLATLSRAYLAKRMMTDDPTRCLPSRPRPLRRGDPRL